MFLVHVTKSKLLRYEVYTMGQRIMHGEVETVVVKRLHPKGFVEKVFDACDTEELDAWLTGISVYIELRSGGEKRTLVIEQ